VHDVALSRLVGGVSAVLSHFDNLLSGSRNFAPLLGVGWVESDTIGDVLDEVLDHADVLVTVASASEHSRRVLGELNWLASLDEVEGGDFLGGFHD